MLTKDMQTMAKQAAKIKVHEMPTPPAPKKSKGNEPIAYDESAYMKEKPRLRLNSVQMPGLKDMKDMKPGEDCLMMVRATMSGYSQESYMKGESEATFEIQEIAMMPTKKSMDADHK